MYIKLKNYLYPSKEIHIPLNYCEYFYKFQVPSL